MAPKYTLDYFNFTGRAETIRLLFHVAGVEFNDNREFDYGEFSKIKNDVSKYPLGQLPILHVNDRVIIQSNTICRYLAREFDLYGNTNLEKTTIDEITDIVLDITNKFINIFAGGFDEQTKKKKIVELFSGPMFTKSMDFMTNILKNNNGGKGYFVGDKITLADLYLYGYHCLYKESAADTYNIDKYPEIKSLLERVENLPSIQKYLQSNHASK